MKLKQFQSYLKKEKIQVTFFTHEDPTLSYFVQYLPTHGYLAITQKKALFFASPLDNPPKRANISNKYLQKGWDDQLQKIKPKKVGINKNKLTVSQLERLKKLFKGAKFVDVSKKLAELRLEKTTKEIEKIAKACKITSDAFTALVKELPKKRLKTEQDVAFFLEKYYKQRGCEIAFPTIAAVGKNAAIPHHQTSSDKLKRGFLLCDFGAKYQQYCADMTRCVFLGSPTQKEKQWYNLLLKAQVDATNAVKEGISYKELDGVSRRVLGKHEKNFIHSLGHGIGIEVHENPVFSSKDVVQKNVPFTIEPGIYFKGKFGLRIEDTVVWDGKRIRILTTASKKFQSVKI